jgi:hypothetical protein
MHRSSIHRLAARNLLAMAVASIASAHSEAAVVVNSAGFEPTAYNTGTLEGQQGWFNAGAGGATAVVQTTVVKSGAQAVKLTRTAQSNRYFGRFINSPPVGRYMSIDWDMRFEATGSTGVFGPFLGVNGFYESSGGAIGFVAGFGVDVTTRELLYQQGGTGNFVAGSVVPANTWAHYRIDFDFGTDTYKSYYNGTLVATTGFVDAHLGIDRLTDVDMVALPAAGDSGSQGQTGVAYFDNLTVQDGVRGDYNNDGLVNAADYTVWRDSLNQTGFGLAADGDSDGVIGAADYQVWKTAYGSTNAMSPAIAIPEPAAVGMLMTAGVASAFRRVG